MPNTSAAAPRNVPGNGGPEHDLDAPHEGSHLAHVEVRHRELHEANEPADDPGMILALERDLLVVHDYGAHGLLDPTRPGARAWQPAGACWSLRSLRGTDVHAGGTKRRLDPRLPVARIEPC